FRVWVCSGDQRGASSNSDTSVSQVFPKEGIRGGHRATSFGGRRSSRVLVVSIETRASNGATVWRPLNIPIGKMHFKPWQSEIHSLFRLEKIGG
ncbi:hypothetical protein GIB67_004141, partial [Kingdonia uniflora]